MTIVHNSGGEGVPEQAQFAAVAKDLYMSVIERVAKNPDWLHGQPFGLVAVQLNHVISKNGSPYPQGLRLVAEPADDRFAVQMKDWSPERQASRVMPEWPGAVTLGRHVYLGRAAVTLQVDAAYTHKKGQATETVYSLCPPREGDVNMFGEAVELVALLKEYLDRSKTFELRGSEVLSDASGGRILTDHHVSLELSPEVRVTDAMPNAYLTALIAQLRHDRDELSEQFDNIFDNVGADLGNAGLDTTTLMSQIANERTLVKDTLANATDLCLKRGIRV